MHRTGQQGLPAVRDRSQPSATVDRLPEVVAFVAKLRLGRVQCDPYPQRRRRPPPLGVQVRLGVQRGRQRV